MVRWQPFAIPLRLKTVPPLVTLRKKIVHPIQNNCIPLYFGAERVFQICGENCCHRLVGVMAEDIELIESILQNPDGYRLDLRPAVTNVESGTASFQRFALNHLKGK